MLSFAKSGVNHGYWLTFCGTCEFRESNEEDADDGVRMHEYLLCTVLDSGSVCL
jgi:hypothetical protein